MGSPRDDSANPGDARQVAGESSDLSRELTECPFLVPSRNGLVRRHDLRKSWDRLRAAAKIPADLHVHDLRRSFGLRATLSVGIFGASKLLRHANTGVTERVYAPIAPQQMTTYAQGVEAARVLAFRKKKTAAA